MSIASVNIMQVTREIQQQTGNSGQNSAEKPQKCGQSNKIYKGNWQISPFNLGSSTRFIFYFDTKFHDNSIILYCT